MIRMKDEIVKQSNQEKKVEYLELIYDLIFVYMIGRNNSLLQNFENGFVSPKAFFAYVLCTLAIIQIWNFTTFYINMFGRNGVREHIFLCVNMYLMYFIGESTRTDWYQYQTQYHIAWGLILVNIGIQYLIEMRNHKADFWNQDIIRRMCITLFIEATLVFIAGIPNPVLGEVFSALAIAAGIALTAFSRKKSISGSNTDFPHLTERAMLYVVFTFGEMIIAVATYFAGDGNWNWNTIYYSLMAFLIVVGLFLSYEIIYDKLINREGEYDGMLYLALHIFIIFALNNITSSLEFMREEEIALLPKMLFLVISVIVYFVFLFSLKRYVKVSCIVNRRFMMILCGATIAFIILMLLLREQMIINILITVIYVFSVFALIYTAGKHMDKKNEM